MPVSAPFFVVFAGPRLNQVYRPQLELLQARFFELLRACEVRWRADDLIRAQAVGMLIAQMRLHKIDSGKRNNDSDQDLNLLYAH